MLTFLPLEQIDEMDGWEGAKLNQAKEILAYELTKTVHGEEEANKAQASAKALFGSGDEADIPSVALCEDDFTDGVVDIPSILVKSGLVKSKSEARQAILQGGVTMDGDKITDVKATCTKEKLTEGVLIRKGKKSYMKVVYKA